MAKTIQDYKNDYAKAQAKGDKAGMQKAHAGAEAIRAKSGYSGGVDGSQHIPLPSNTSGNKNSSGSSSNKKTSSGSKSSSGSSNKSSYSSSSTSSANPARTGASKTFTGTAEEYDYLNNQAAQKAASWKTATTQAEKDRLHNEAAVIQQKLGRTYDSKTGIWSGGYARPAASSPSTSSSVTSSTTLAKPFYGTAEEWDEHDRNAKQYSLLWNYAQTPEQKQQLHDWAAAENTALGRTYDSKTGIWSGGYERPEDKPAINELYQDAFDEYYGKDAAAEQEELIRAANQAAVDQNILALNAQKDAINRARIDGNAAAEQAYMQAINPNGSLAESLAANGLLTSGLTESSQIAAGNAYQSALNKNNNTVTQQLAEIERAISQAQLSGDLATAEQLQQWYNKVADAALQNVRDIVANTWQQKNYDLTKAGQEASITGRYNGAPTLEANRINWEKQFQEAGLTGKYNGNLTLEGLAAQDQHALDQVTLATAKENYRILLAFGYAEEEARKIALELANEGQRLTNELSRQDIQYGERQLAKS